MRLDIVDNATAKNKSANVAIVPPINIFCEMGPTMPGIKKPITAEPNIILAESVRKSVITSIPVY